MRFCFNIKNIFQHRFRQQDTTWNLSRIFRLCYREVSFSKRVLSAWLGSTWASSEVFCQKSVLRNFSKFTGKHMCQSLFFNKVEDLPFFIGHLWLLFLNMKSRHQQQQQHENSRKNLAAWEHQWNGRKKYKANKQQISRGWIRLWTISSSGLSISSHLEYKLEWI